MAAKDNKKETKEKEAALPEGQAEKPRKKSRAKKIVIILAILLLTLGCAGLGGYWWLYMRQPAAPVQEEQAQQPAAENHVEEPQGGESGDNSLKSAKIERQSDLPRSSGMVLPLPPITVNLSEPSGRRYLKLGMEVEVNSDVAAQLKAQNARIRDAIIMLLAGKSYGEVASPDGKVLLKAEIAARLNQILGGQKVVRVYFTDFVVN